MGFTCLLAPALMFSKFSQFIHLFVRLLCSSNCPSAPSTHLFSCVLPIINQKSSWQIFLLCHPFLSYSIWEGTYFCWWDVDVIIMLLLNIGIVDNYCKVIFFVFKPHMANNAVHGGSIVYQPFTSLYLLPHPARYNIHIYSPISQIFQHILMAISNHARGQQTMQPRQMACWHSHLTLLFFKM